MTSRLSLKKLKVYKAMSEETLAFTADLYFDGALVATVNNSGRGGCNEYRATDNTAFKKAEDYANSLKTEFDFEKLDQAVDDIIQEEQQQKDYKRICKKVVAFFENKEAQKNGEYRTFKYEFTTKLKTHIMNKYPNAIIMNELIGQIAK